MAITVKKTASPKTLRVAPNAGAAVGAPQAGGAVAAPSPFIQVKKRSYLADVIVGSIACLVFIALLVIQYMEWSYFDAPLRAFQVFNTAEESLTLLQQWGAAPLGAQIGLVLAALMLLVGLVGLILSIVKSVKAKSAAKA